MVGIHVATAAFTVPNDRSWRLKMGLPREDERITAVSNILASPAITNAVDDDRRGCHGFAPDIMLCKGMRQGTLPPMTSMRWSGRREDEPMSGGKCPRGSRHVRFDFFAAMDG